MSERPRIIAEIQARTGSTRLPGKIHADIEGRTMLGRILDAARRVKGVDDVIVATTASPLDDRTAAWCESEGVACFRGSEEDVLARVRQAVEQMSAEVVVQMTGDNPFYCPEVIDAQLDLFLNEGFDYVGDNVEPSYPVGCGAKIFRARMLTVLDAWCNDRAVREHVSLFFYEHPERYRVGTLVAPEHLRWPRLRVTVDTPEDLAFAQAVFAAIKQTGKDISYELLVDVVRAGRLDRLNSAIKQKPPRRHTTTVGTGV